MSGYFEINKTKDGQFYFNLKAGNHEIILSSELYTTRTACENGIESVKINSQKKAQYDNREAKNGSPYFVLKAGNGQEIGRSEMFEGAIQLDNAIESVQRCGSTEAIKDKTEAIWSKRSNDS